MATLIDLNTIKDGGIISDGVVYISSYRKSLKKDGKNYYIAGTLTQKDMSMSFKVWDSNIIEIMDGLDFNGSVAVISGSVSSYMNNLDIKITAISKADESEYPKSLFLKSADVNGLFKEFTDFIMGELSKPGIMVIQGIFQSENLFGRFKEEFAGSHMHDALVGGLLHHTMKMLRIAKCIYQSEPRMSSLPNYKDLLYLSIILHDIGKVYEMNLGVYTENSFVTHRTLGLELVAKYKKAIIQCFDERFYYQILAVIQGHHGAEFGDAPTTITAYIVHLIDMLDSQTTGIFDKIERNEVTTRAGGISVNEHGLYLLV